MTLSASPAWVSPRYLHPGYLPGHSRPVAMPAWGWTRTTRCRWIKCSMPTGWPRSPRVANPHHGQIGRRWKKSACRWAGLARARCIWAGTGGCGAGTSSMCHTKGACRTHPSPEYASATGQTTSSRRRWSRRGISTMGWCCMWMARQIASTTVGFHGWSSPDNIRLAGLPWRILPFRLPR